jgi:hypothetical protein
MESEQLGTASQRTETLVCLGSVDYVFNLGFHLVTGFAAPATAPVLEEDDLAPIGHYACSLTLRAHTVDVSTHNPFFYRYHLIPRLRFHIFCLAILSIA